MAHQRQYAHCNVITIDAADARGYDKRIVTSKPKRFFKGNSRCRRRY